YGVGGTSEPAVVVERCNDHWHAIVHLSHQFVRLRRDDRECVNWFAILRRPPLPQPGECEQCSVPERYFVWLILGSLCLPFIKPPRRHQTPLRVKGRPKCVPFLECLRRCVDHSGGEREVA